MASRKSARTPKRKVLDSYEEEPVKRTYRACPRAGCPSLQPKCFAHAAKRFVLLKDTSAIANEITVSHKSIREDQFCYLKRFLNAVTKWPAAGQYSEKTK